MRRDETVSPQLKPALLALDETLKLLASELDAVVFRDTWKAIAVAINRELYNDVATEAKFSFQVGTWHPSGRLLYIRPAALDTEACCLTHTKTPLVHRVQMQYRSVDETSLGMVFCAGISISEMTYH